VTNEKHEISDEQVNLWKQNFPSFFTDNQKDAKKLIKETKEIRKISIPSIPKMLFFGCNNLITLDFFDNIMSQIPSGVFNDCTSLKKIYFNKIQLSELPDGLFDNCRALEWIDFSDNRLSKIPNRLLANCRDLNNIDFSNNQLREMPDCLFDNCRALKQINFNNNKLFKIPDDLFGIIPTDLLDNCFALEWIDFSNNQLSKIPERLFKNCPKLEWIYFGNNQLSEIPDVFLNNCSHLQVIDFSDNRLSNIPNRLLANCRVLKTIDFNNNQLREIPDRLLDNCTYLEWIYFTNNQLSEIPDGLFDNCPLLKRIFFINNQLSKIPERLFKNCSSLKDVDFSGNRIKTFPDNLLSRCADQVRSFNFEKNNIQAVSFRSLEPLSNCSDINLTDNFLYNSKSLYSLMFQTSFCEDFVHFINRYRYFDSSDSKYFIIRLSDDEVEKHLLAFYLSSSSKSSKSIKFLKSNFFSYKTEKGSEFSLLDLFISVFGEIDDSKIINLKKHIDQLTMKDEKLVNVEFLVRSEKTIESLCTRNIHCHFETFFPNFFYELISRVQKTNINAVDFKYDEEFAFESFCKYVAIKKDTKEIIFHLIDYTKCFNIALKNKNHEIAKFVVILLRYYVMVWSDFKNIEIWTKDLTENERKECSEKARDALNNFNRNLLENIESIFENGLGEIITFLLDIKKLDKLKQNKREFLEYDIDRFNSKQTHYASNSNKKKEEFLVNASNSDKKKKEFLQFARGNDDILKHESVNQIFTEKWREKAAIKYYFDLLMFIVFVISYTIYIESKGKSDVDATFHLSAWYISLILSIINLILEVFQCMMHIIYRKFSQYITRYVIK